MAAHAQAAKVLRIGIIQDGKIVQERLIKSGESVRVGESSKNTFVFPKTSLNRSEFPLFVHKGGAYHLHFTGEMKGKISAGGAVVALEKLRTDPSVAKQGDVWRLPLTEQDRGKVGVDNVTVLFQFVPPPPVQAVKPIGGLDFRPRMFDEDDPAFYGFLALFTALGVVFSLFIWVAPPPPELTILEIEERFAHLVQEEEKEKEVEVPDPEENQDQSAERKEKEKEKEKDKTKAEPKKPKDKLQLAREREARKEALKNKIKIARIGTRGRSTGGTTSDAYEDGVLNDLDGIDGSGVTVEGTSDGLRKGDTDTEDAQIGDLKANGASTTEGSSEPAVDMSNYKVQAESGDMADVEGAENVESVVQKRSGQLNYCYEEQLRADPGLSGRIEVQWVVGNKRVTSISVLSNTTGNDALAECITKKVKRWRFGEEVQGAVSWPFVFRKK